MTDDAQALPRIVLVDGDTTTALSAEALAVALLAVIPVSLRRDAITMALHAQEMLDRGDPVRIETNRVIRPDNGRLP